MHGIPATDNTRPQSSRESTAKNTAFAETVARVSLLQATILHISNKKWRPPLLPISMMKKWRVSTWARIHLWFWGEGGTHFSFYLVQDCRLAGRNEATCSQRTAISGCRSSPIKVQLSFLLHRKVTLRPRETTSAKTSTSSSICMGMKYLISDGASHTYAGFCVTHSPVSVAPAAWLARFGCPSTSVTSKLPVLVDRRRSAKSCKFQLECFQELKKIIHKIFSHCDR